MGTALVLAVILAGCQSLPRAVPAVADGTPAAEAFAERQRQAAAESDWTLRGRTAVSAHGRGWSGSVNWVQDGDALDLRFIAPLGAGTVRILGTPGAMHIQGSDGTDILTDDPESELAQYLGVAVPVTAMRWWVLGVPVPGLGLAYLDLDEAGRAVHIVQAGWSVRYPRYAEYDGRILPAIIEADDGDTRVRLVVDRFDSDIR